MCSFGGESEDRKSVAPGTAEWPNTVAREVHRQKNVSRIERQPPTLPPAIYQKGRRTAHIWIIRDWTHSKLLLWAATSFPTALLFSISSSPGFFQPPVSCVLCATGGSPLTLLQPLSTPMWWDLSTSAWRSRSLHLGSQGSASPLWGMRGSSF